ncbi:hypothetical protein M6D81_29265 [Paenibacillus sp. J5C_2022]|uniref:hypothetical protein n=1 Tax=Paenibacillus sp. J5C2022 TaxID=2977129 RepID=UPI0021D2C75E|nr:hypothetical protein [Paenibacillus sp. J5C2022]MCU6712799.1 hypothetical protein [Paenibacillus sp. J5C2022]
MSARVEISGWNRRRVGGAFKRRHRRRRRFFDDSAVEGIQEAGKVLGADFNNLRRRSQARKLAAAIRHCDARAVNNLFDFPCRTVCFFKRPGFDCVKICCFFGRGSVNITLDICVSQRTGDIRFGF